jgi:5-methylcytosine-specific restriction enzyme A
MLSSQRELIIHELEEGTGAQIEVETNQGGLRSGMRIWFSDLGPKNGPIAEVRPHGLKSHSVKLSFGDFSGAVIGQIGRASFEDRQLALALVASIEPNATIDIKGQNLDDWSIKNGNFTIDMTIRHEARPDTDNAISRTCREVIVPIMAAMAELIGYDIVENETSEDIPKIDGALTRPLVQRRERNPRNKLLCIRIHGQICAACGLDPCKRYGQYGSVIEVHHLEPLANLKNPRPYDPATDLVPLCPNCHRVAHTRRPAPWTINEIKSMLENRDA